MGPCISQATTLSSSFKEDVVGYAGGGCSALEVWLTKLETHLEAHSVSETKSLLQDHAITLAGASYQGGLLLSQGAQRQLHWEHFRRRLEICETFSIPTLLVAPDFAEKVDAGSVERAIASLAEAAQWAAGSRVQLALEFRAHLPFCSSLPTALSLVQGCGEPNVGVALDLFHYYCGPSKFEDFEGMDARSLAFVQVADLAGVPRELARDADRIFPGEGDFQLAPVIARLRDLGYKGWVSLELLNPTLWQLKTSQVAELGQRALARLLSLEIGAKGMARRPQVVPVTSA
jgi:sugar phosphate isomerase/epimerase